MDTNIFHDNITAKNFIITNTRALIYLGLHGSVTKRIKYKASGMLTYREKSLNTTRSSSSFCSQRAVILK